MPLIRAGDTVIIKVSDRDRSVLSGNWGGTASNRPRRQSNLAPGIFYFKEKENYYDKKDQKLLGFIG